MRCAWCNGPLLGSFIVDAARDIRVCGEDHRRKWEAREADARWQREQPPPIHNDRAPVWSLVIDDLKAGNGGAWCDMVIVDARERDRIGRERYGTPLQAHNGRDALVDAYQEALDLAAYLRQEIEEHPAPIEPYAGFTYRLYTDALDLAMRVRGRIAERGDP